MSDWKKAGMSEAAAKNYLGAIKASLNSPNMILDLRIPQNQKYQQVVLDEAVSRFLAGEIDKDATIKAIESGWNDLNDEIGKDVIVRVEDVLLPIWSLRSFQPLSIVVDRGLLVDLARQEARERLVEHDLLVFLVLRNAQIEDHVRAVQAVLDGAEVDLRLGLGHVRPSSSRRRR